jgi:hypothetical protein
MSDDLTPLEPSGSSPMPFEALEQPLPTAPTPPVGARWAAFAGILVGGLLGGMIGYGTSDLLSDKDLWVGLGTIAGAAIGAVGVGIMAALTLRAMSEWKATQHPEAPSEPASAPTSQEVDQT